MGMEQEEFMETVTPGESQSDGVLSSLYSSRKRYTAEAGHTLPGRPMPFVLWNVSDVTVKKFFIIDPPLWSFNIMNGTDVWVDELYCNATATKANASQNWVQNTDGFGENSKV
jgi:hypothetical protein